MPSDSDQKAEALLRDHSLETLQKVAKWHGIVNAILIGVFASGVPVLFLFWVLTCRASWDSAVSDLHCWMVMYSVALMVVGTLIAAALDSLFVSLDHFAVTRALELARQRFH